MALLGRKLAVSIPDTLLEEKDSPREKTAKLGQIARACAIYGVDLVEVFRDPRGTGEGGTIRKVLEYLETPQYLRRRLYPIDESLRFAGVLPPLRIPSHKAKVKMGELRTGEIREGVVNGDGTVDVGLDLMPRLGSGTRPGKRVTVKITSVEPLTAEQVPREKVVGYWGYTVEEMPAEGVLEDPRFDLKVATSRMGTPLNDVVVPLRKALGGAGGVKLLFGPPSRGLFDIFGSGLAKKVDFVANLFPGQQVETVRTEEAIIAGLGLIGVLSVEKA